MLAFNASISLAADSPAYDLRKAKATLPSGVKKGFRPRFTLKLFGRSSIRPKLIAISRRGKKVLMRPSSVCLKESS